MNNNIKLVTVLTASDGVTFQEAKCKFFGKVQDLKMLGSYGISYNPPVNSFGVAFSANGYDNNIFVVADRPKDRFKGLAPGELKIGNYLTGASIHFKADGSIEVAPKAGQVVNVTGPIEVIGDVTANNFISTGLPGVDFNTHVHSDPQGGLTGVPQ